MDPTSPKHLQTKPLDPKYGPYTGLSEYRGPQYSILTNRILIIRTPK